MIIDSVARLITANAREFLKAEEDQYKAKVEGVGWIPVVLPSG